jgi:multidrug efflux pump subunit AcrA (membrane-fusion protein)
LKVPVSALIFRTEGLQVAIVANDRIRMVPVTAGRDFGSDVEISSGLSGDERVVVNPPDSLVDGVAVRVVTQPANTGGAAR